VTADVEFLGPTRQAGFANESGPRFGKFALRQAGECPVKVIADHEIENGIAEEFEALVMIQTAVFALVGVGGVD
jgi:hypothetical protein